jgi:hypothetical protein
VIGTAAGALRIAGERCYGDIRHNWIFPLSSCILSSFAGGNPPQEIPIHREGIEEERAVGNMNSNMVLGGFLLMLICQDIVAVKAIKKNVRDGILCAMIPGYILFYANREGASQYTKPLIGWLAGLGLILMSLMR